MLLSCVSWGRCFNLKVSIYTHSNFFEWEAEWESCVWCFSVTFSIYTPLPFPISSKMRRKLPFFPFNRATWTSYCHLQLRVACRKGYHFIYCVRKDVSEILCQKVRRNSVESLGRLAPGTHYVSQPRSNSLQVVCCADEKAVSHMHSQSQHNCILWQYNSLLSWFVFLSAYLWNIPDQFNLLYCNAHDVP